MDTCKSVTAVTKELRVMYVYIYLMIIFTHNTESVYKLVNTSTSDLYAMILH